MEFIGMFTHDYLAKTLTDGAKVAIYNTASRLSNVGFRLTFTFHHGPF